ncbi:MAG: hypothetical protein U0793_27420 [Gemmataceae bacterium]
MGIATLSKSARNRNGTFALGNPGGPGRPPRAVERDYLAILGDIWDRDAWADVCRRALHEAKRGDARARDWASRYLLGAGGLPTLVTLRQEDAEEAAVEECERQMRLQEERRREAGLISLDELDTLP